MNDPFHDERRRQIRSALAANAYRDNLVRLAETDLDGAHWLVATPRGLFAVGSGGARLAIHGWFFGICRDGDDLYLFENCALRQRTKPWGRLLRLRINHTRLDRAQVIAGGLDANCHQVRIIRNHVCVVDTANQRILRFTRDGIPIGPVQLFPPASGGDRGGAYLHINSIAEVAGRIAVMIHNGKAMPDRPSEIAWLDSDWAVVEREPIAGYGCHDLCTDPAGATWFCASKSGEIAALDGRRMTISDRLMTRGIAFARGQIAVGLASFGERQLRDGLGGAIVILDHTFKQIGEVKLDGPPADIAALSA